MKTITLKPPLQIKADGLHLVLIQPFQINVRFEDGFITLSNPELNIYVYFKESDSNLFQELAVEIGILWQGFVLEDDKNLTQDAVELKLNLINLFSELNRE